MKKLLLSTVCAITVLMSASMAVNARELSPQDRPHHGDFEHRPNKKEMKKRGDKMTEALSLTDAQKAQAEKIREEGRKKVEPLMNDMKQIREKMDKLREENIKEFEAILTPEQKTKLEKIKEDRKADFEAKKAERKAKGGKPGPRPEPKRSAK